MTVGTQMAELDRGALLPPPPQYKLGSQNTPYKLGLKYISLGGRQSQIIQKV